MKAIEFTEYGAPEVLHLVEAARPAPKQGEVSIRVYATNVGYGDTLARNFRAVSARGFHMLGLFWFFTKFAFGWKKPKVQRLGSEFSGVIDAVGEGVTTFRPGDPVFGYLGERMGGYAEYVCMKANGALALKPASMTHEQAAVAPMGAMTALALLKKVNVQRGQRVLVLGASGGIGAAAVQLAKHFGAEVTGVCGARRLDFVRALGAHHVIDYSREDFARNGQTYDVILDVLGKSSFARCRGSLTPQGRYLLASFKTKQLLQMAWTSLAGGKRVVCVLAPESPEDLRAVRELIERGALRSIIDRTFPLEQAAEAHRYVESGEKQGQVVITVARGAGLEEVRISGALTLPPALAT
ncbi:MAG: NAD(P)-dependent alcohol dehydrogenase [Archangium sp.]|nr:NAD(P)-dependent alcohol dehydrogenase [Archangium sp.]